MAELIVVIGVLLLMLALAGQAMSFTVRATGQATAVTEVSQALRAIERTLRMDLAAVRRDRSVLLIQGNPINAYWSQFAKDADDDKDPSTGTVAVDAERLDPLDPSRPQRPRGDILMFFTERKMNSYVQYPGAASPLDPPQSITSQMQQVVYGHADLGAYEYDRVTDKWAFESDPDAFPDYPTVSPTPADGWHLARRVVHLMPVEPPPVAVGASAWVNYCTDFPRGKLDASELLDGASDAVGNFDARYLLWPCPTASNLSDPDTRSLPCPVPQMGHCVMSVGDPPSFLPKVFDTQSPIFSRSRLDQAPPVVMADRLGHYFAANCASFKVEWSLDPFSAFVGGRLDLETDLYWIDPGDQGPDLSIHVDDNPLRSLMEAWERVDALATSTPSAYNAARFKNLDSLLDPDHKSGSGADAFSLRKRFAGLVEKGDLADWHGDPLGDEEHPNTVVFVANRSAAKEPPNPDEAFPAALRITIDLYDTQRRLERPVRHVMVIPIGS